LPGIPCNINATQGIGKVPEAFPTPGGFVAIVQRLSARPMGNEPEVSWWFPRTVDPTSNGITPGARKRGATPIERTRTNLPLLGIDIKAKLGNFDRAGVVGLVQDLYTTSKDNQNFLHARFGLLLAHAPEYVGWRGEPWLRPLRRQRKQRSSSSLRILKIFSDLRDSLTPDNTRLSPGQKTGASDSPIRGSGPG
jgi:hypothetical protein